MRFLLELFFCVGGYNSISPLAQRRLRPSSCYDNCSIRWGKTNCCSLFPCGQPRAVAVSSPAFPYPVCGSRGQPFSVFNILLLMFFHFQNQFLYLRGSQFVLSRCTCHHQMWNCVWFFLTSLTPFREGSLFAQWRWSVLYIWEATEDYEGTGKEEALPFSCFLAIFPL